MKKLLVILGVLILVGGGFYFLNFQESEEVEVAVEREEMGETEDVLELLEEEIVEDIPEEEIDGATSGESFTLGKESWGLRLTFPPEWEGVFGGEDFAGYGDSGEEGPYAFEVGGRALTFRYDDKVMFVVMRIYVEDKGHPAIPDDQQYLAENDTYVFYGSRVTEEGTFKFLYDDYTEEELMLFEDIDEIWRTIELI